MADAPQIFSVLELSTAHLSKDVAEQLTMIASHHDRTSWLDDDWQALVLADPRSEHGWWVWVDLEAVDNLPPCLKHCLMFARDRGCRWVQFDCDVPVIDELPTWIW